mmetsp:Transcript_10817/g.28074  ORF Transcript_10817/g.28074 Transcript_10817/m.28074 type:complete len:274 (+) Transcript_10817:454-1275(+)
MRTVFGSLVSVKTVRPCPVPAPALVLALVPRSNGCHRFVLRGVSARSRDAMRLPRGVSLPRSPRGVSAAGAALMLSRATEGMRLRSWLVSATVLKIDFFGARLIALSGMLRSDAGIADLRRFGEPAGVSCSLFCCSSACVGSERRSDDCSTNSSVSVVTSRKSRIGRSLSSLPNGSSSSSAVALMPSSANARKNDATAVNRTSCSGGTRGRPSSFTRPSGLEASKSARASLKTPAKTNGMLSTKMYSSHVSIWAYAMGSGVDLIFIAPAMARP